MSERAPSARTRVRRLPELAVYQRERLNAIVDEALYCHLAWVGGDGEPRVIPTIHVRRGDVLYVHGSSASSTLRAIKTGLPVAIAVTIVDGIRFARSMFEHSMNYRTVIVYGTAQEVTDPEELAGVFDAITDHVAPGRSADARPPNPDELRQTTFVQRRPGRGQREGERRLPRGARGRPGPRRLGRHPPAHGLAGRAGERPAQPSRRRGARLRPDLATTGLTCGGSWGSISCTPRDRSPRRSVGFVVSIYLVPI